MNGSTLEVNIYRGNQSVSHFMLDFVNESLAISRNVYLPSYVKFKVNVKERVSGVFCNGLEFSKTATEDNSSIVMDHGRVGFSIPNGFTTSVNGFNFIATTYDISIQGGIKDKDFEKDIMGSLTHDLPTDELIHQGLPITFVEGPFLWHQRSFVYKVNGDEIEFIILYSESSKSFFWLSLKSPSNAVTRNIQKSVEVMTGSLFIN